MMNKETVSIYAGGLIQGIALVAFPAVSTILTSPSEFDFSGTTYGSLFIPQSILSITAAACNPKLSRKFGSKSVFLAGIMANLISMMLLAMSMMFVKNQAAAYALLIVATGCLGLGFGLVVPTINSIAALLHPGKIDAVLLLLNALLGIGTALSPLLVSLFVGFGFWWGLPVLLTLFLIVLFVFTLPLPLPGGKISISSSVSIPIPSRIWIFAAFATLYGIIETLNGNWISIYMSQHLHATIQMQSLALTAFWGMVTFGRLFYASIQSFFREQLAFQISPFISAFAFLMISSLSPGTVYWAILAFGLTGFGCSTLLPLTISFGSKQLKTISSSVPGMVISFYLLGYGIAAFGVGPLEELGHISLSEIYAFGAVVAFILGIISLFIIQNKKSNQS